MACSQPSTGKLYLMGLLNDDKWKDALATPEFDLESYFESLEKTLQNEYDQGKEIYPPRELIFNALNLTPLKKVKVVILGQDPYPGYGQAMGLSFSVKRGIDTPRSLINMYNELERDPEIPEFKKPDHGCLVDWAKEGVLLLNTTLTVEANIRHSHAHFGWQTFTDEVIKAVSKNCNHVVFILMGTEANKILMRKVAKKKYDLIDSGKHTIIKTRHPSPLAVIKPASSLIPFKECDCFSACNVALEKKGQTPVNWNLF